MEALKTYLNINSANEKASFAISRMEHIYEQRDGAVDEPHRHNYYTVIIVEDAQGVHKVDFNTYQLGPKQIYFVSPGQVHQVMEERASKGFAMTFSTQFLVQNGIELSFIESLDLFQDYGQAPPLEPSQEQLGRINDLAAQIEVLFEGDSNMKNLSIGAYLKLILIECNNICEVNPIELNEDISENSTLRQFKKLVNEHYKTEHSTSFYASELSISPDHLNRKIKTAIGKTAKEYVQSRIITAAKRLIYFSGLSTKEIAYELGFNEPANFSAFFKKCTGVSPSKFLEEQS